VCFSHYCHLAIRLKQKTHRRNGSGLAKYFTLNESKPDCRAGQQRVRKQQVQDASHAVKLVACALPVNGNS
jgi:hypothetical protein